MSKTGTDDGVSSADDVARAATVDEAAERLLRVEGASWWGGRPESVRRLIASGVVLFSTHGFHATTTREVARHAGMSPTGMYAHFAAKSDLLYEICRTATATILDDLRHSFSMPADPLSRFGNVVATHVRWHADHHMIARMANYEIQFLGGEQQRHMRAMGKQLAEIIRESIWLTQGPDRTNVDGVNMVTRAVVSMGIDVSRWYTSHSSLSPDELAMGYRRLALAMLPMARAGSPAGPHTSAEIAVSKMDAFEAR